MSVVLLLARLLLAGVFLVAGLSKLADRKGSRQAIVDFGLPATHAATIGLGLPLAEGIIGLALLPRPTAWWASIGALALLVAFVGAISYNLARGETPDCHCFGQLHSTPISWRTLMRNGALAVVAGLVIWQGRDDPGGSVFAWLDGVSVTERIGLAAVCLAFGLIAGQGWLLIQILRQNGRLLIRLEAIEEKRWHGGAAPTNMPSAATPAHVGLPLGDPAPAFTLEDLAGEPIALDRLRSGGKPVILVFSDPNCGPCAAFMPDLARYQRDYAAILTITLISRGAAAAIRDKAAEHGLTLVLMDLDREVSKSFLAPGTPSAILIRRDGAIGSAVAQGADQIRSLIASAAGLPALAPLHKLPVREATNGHGNDRSALEQAPSLPTLIVGDAAPPFTLPDLSGNTIAPVDLRGSQTILLFWNPGCGFCQGILNDLKRWEARPPEGAPHLVLISGGSAAENRAMDLTSPILLDSSFRVGHAFGARGTPSAVLIDEHGKIASQIVVGGPAVLTLAGYAHASQ
jgi:peroxiredoxin/uncharacterized membrane protein YphA (DoxX/SURF4 family)